MRSRPAARGRAATAIAIVFLGHGVAADAAADTVPAPDAATVSDSVAAGKAADAPVTWRQVGRDAGYVFGRPAHLDGPGWTRLGVSLGIGAGLYAVRDDVRDFAQDHRDQTPEGVPDAARLMARTATLPSGGGFFIAGAADSGARPGDRLGGARVVAFAPDHRGVAAILATERPCKGATSPGSACGGHSVRGRAFVAASMLAPIIDRHLLCRRRGQRCRARWKDRAIAAWRTVGLVEGSDLRTRTTSDVYFGHLNGLMAGR